MQETNGGGEEASCSGLWWREPGVVPGIVVLEPGADRGSDDLRFPPESSSWLSPRDPKSRLTGNRTPGAVRIIH